MNNPAVSKESEEKVIKSIGDYTIVYRRDYRLVSSTTALSVSAIVIGLVLTIVGDYYIRFPKGFVWVILYVAPWAKESAAIYIVETVSLMEVAIGLTILVIGLCLLERGGTSKVIKTYNIRLYWGDDYLYGEYFDRDSSPEKNKEIAGAIIKRCEKKIAECELKSHQIEMERKQESLEDEIVFGTGVDNHGR